MAKRINALNEKTSLEDQSYFVIDGPNTSDTTNKVSFGIIRDTISTRVKSSLTDMVAVINTNSKFTSISYNNYQYIDDGGSYTKSYTASSNCIVFYHIEWDCNGNDGVMLQILKNGSIVGQIQVFSNFEGNNSEWLNTNGTVPLGAGMTMRFAPTLHSLNTGSGNHMDLLIATI